MDVSSLIIYIKVLLDCDWFTSVQLIPNHSTIVRHRHIVQFSVITVQFSVTTLHAQFSVVTLNQSN